MKYVSEQFKEKQDEIIRPALKLFFEVGSNVRTVIAALEGEAYAGDMGFDDDVAPVVEPDVCTNEHYYAVLGDNSPVDDPNRICSPDISEGMYDMPTISVPFGITTFTPANIETLIGSDTEEYWHNFSGFTTRSTLCFKGHIPSQIRVQRGEYDFETDTINWVDEQIIDNSELNEEVVYNPLGGAEHEFDNRRFWVKNSSNAGRFQLNWIRLDLSTLHDSERLPIVFENELISSVTVDERTDLTSQSLPSYEITVECLDVNEEYTPESDYWNKQFSSGSTFYFRAGFETEGGIEYIPMMIGELTTKPTYGNGKITFKASIEFRWFFGETHLGIDPGSSAATGTEIESLYFKNIIEENSYGGYALFDNYDIFADETDESNSICNYYGIVKEPRQLIANALGGYITSNVYTFDLHRTVDIQYKPCGDYLTRYEQISSTLESQPKVTKISVTRNKNTVSADKTTVDTPTAITLHANTAETLYFTVPYEALSKFVVTDYRKSVSTASITAECSQPEKQPDGTYEVTIYFTSNKNTNIRPKVDFYKIDNAKFEETDNFNSGFLEGEVYTNDNDLVTNIYTANKVKNVARMMNDMTDQYEVDLMQDFRYELGDIIRLETEKNIYKTCVITGMSYKFPGSAGHLTCRKIFSLYDSSYSVIDAEGLNVKCKDNDTEVFSLDVLETSENACAIGYWSTSGHLYLLVLGTDKVSVTEGGTTTEYEPNAILTDLNNHDWNFSYFDIPVSGSGSVVTTAPTIELPDYDSDSGVSEGAYLAIEMLKEIYSEQNMTAPVDYTCDWQTT